MLPHRSLARSFAAALALAPGCQPRADAGAPPSAVLTRADGAAGSTPSDPPEPDVPEPPEALRQLEVPEFRAAWLVDPGGVAPKPVLIAAHGAGDGPRFQCELWRLIVAGRGFVLCPAGVPLDRDSGGYFFRNHHELEREVLAALAALQAELGDRVASGPVVYTGYSQGATMGALMLVGHADVFSRVALIEGGERQWNVPIARKFARAGGQRVLFACGRRSCFTGAQRSADWLEQAGIAARVEHAAGAGHTYGGAVAERVAASFDWLVEGDERWLTRDR
ncbi:MAG TPA: hypothetical protein VKZ49_13195 [Polyangiaceae bacterium]|nr:hypothetical protein [Polyangiaceae bacterium]